MEEVGAEDLLEEGWGKTFGFVLINQHHLPRVSLALNHLKENKAGQYFTEFKIKPHENNFPEMRKKDEFMRHEIPQ